MDPLVSLDPSLILDFGLTVSIDTSVIHLEFSSTLCSALIYTTIWVPI